MIRNHSGFIRGVRALTALALVLSVVPLGTVSAAPLKPIGPAAQTVQRPVVDAAAAVEKIRAERSALRAGQVTVAPAAIPPQAPNAVNIAATKRDAIVNDVDEDGRADPGDTLRYTVVITNSGDTDATSVVFSDSIDNNTVLSGTVKSTPLARNDAYNAVGNVRISLSAGAGVLANDSDPDGSAISVVISSTTSTNGGNVAVNANGSFTYNPPPGFEGGDTFTYTIQDLDGNQNSATVTVTVSGMIWFVNAAAAAGGDGRLTAPFNCLSGAGCFSTAADDPGDNIFVYENATAYSGGITLLNNQKLIGQDASSSLATLAGVTPPSYSDALPTMNTGAPASTINGGTNAVALAQNNALYGFTAGNATGASVSGNTFGTLLVNEVIINTTGAGLSLNTGAFGSPATFTSITSSGGTNNVSLTSITGTANLGSGALSGASSHAFVIDGGTAVLAYSGTINNTTARSVSVINKTGGSVTFSGAVNGTAQGVFLNNNTGATINFMGGLALNTGANAAFTATGGGTVNVCDENPCNPAATGALVNTLTTTTGSALNMANTTIGPNNLEFRSISANGGANGIVLNTTGSSGGLKVKGDNGGSNNGSGGTIQNTTAESILLNNTANVSLGYMNINNSGTDSIRITTINGFILNRSNISDSAGATTDKGIDIGDFSTGTAVNGTITIVNSVIGPAAGSSPHDSLAIGISSGTSTWSITGTTFRNTGNSGINLELRGTAVVSAFTVSSSSFLGAGTATSARGIFANNLDDSIMGNLTVQTSTFTNNNIHIDINQQNDTDPVGSSTFNILNNTTLTGANSHAINIFAAAGPFGGTFTGNINGNVIGNPGVAGSGSAIGNGIRVNINGGSDANIHMDGNTIRQTPNGRGLEVIARNGTGGLDMTVTNNDINPQDTSGFPLAAIFLQSNCVTTCNTLRADVRGNTVPAGATFDLLPTFIAVVRTNTSTCQVVDNPPPSANATAELTEHNTGSASASAACTLISGPISMAPSSEISQALAWNQIESNPTATMHAAKTSEAAQDLPVQSEGGNSKPLLSLPFNRAFAPQADRTVEVNRVNGPITPLTIGILPAGKTVTLTFEVVINNPMTPGVTQVSNQGTIGGGNFASVLTDDPDTGTANDPTVTPLDIQVDLQVTKTVNPATAYPGLPITYTITYQNAGPQASTNVVITDPIPSALTGVAYQSSATVTPTGSYVWTIGTLLNGQGGVITVTGTISPLLAVPTTITNTATITGTGRDTNIGNNTTSVGLPINDRPISGLSAINSSPTLLGSATAFTATVGAGTNVVYQWNFGDGSTGSGATAARTYAAIGTYTATVTATNSSNSQVATTVVTVVDVPIAGLNTTNDSPTRLGNATNFTATINAGSNVAYVWDFGDGATGSGSTPAHTYAALGTYTATVTATNSVNQQVATTLVTVIDRPITGLSAANDSPTQLGNTTHFTASISGGSNVTYQWNFGDGALGSGANTSHTYGAVSSYVATVTATNGVSVVVATTNVSIVNVPITDLTAANSSPTILGNATSFTATISGGTNVVYTWNFGDGVLGSGATTSHTYTSVGTYTATVTATNGSNTQVASTAVVIFDIPITGLNATSDSPTRLGNATHFTATTTGGSGITYVWEFGDGNFGSGVNQAHTYAALGMYTATVTATNSLNSQTASTVVVVIDQPILGLNAANDSPTRLGSATHFTATISNGTNVTYQWNFGDGSLGSGVTTSHTYGAIGSYVATVTATNGVSVVVATTNVSIIDTPIVNLVAANDSPTRLGSATNFTATIGGGSNVAYQWNFGDGSLGSGANAAHIYGSVGSYVATVTATNGVSVVVATTNVSIIDRAIVGLSATNSSPTGLGNTTTFTATINDGTNVTYAWNFGDGATGNGANTSHTYGAIGAYTATVTATNGVSVVTASTVATVINQPISGLNAISSSPTRLGSATAFTATIATGSTVSYVWNFGDGTTGSGMNAAHTYGAVGTYTATVTATNSINSQVASTVVVVIDRAIVGLSANNDSPTRLGSTTALTAAISDGSNVAYQWNFGDGSLGSGANANHVYSAVGAYVATVTATNGVSVVVATTNVSIIDTLIVNLTAANSSPTGLGLATLLTATIGGGSNVVYQWNFGDGVVGSGATPSHSYPALGVYTATVTATNGVSNVVATTLVTIVDQPLTTLSATSSSPTLLGNTSFFTTTANGTSVIYAWSFGDGATGNGANAAHTYTATGLYTAIVTATNSTGSLTATAKVNVFSGKTYLPMIARNYVSAPDLVVTSLKASTGDVRVVIKNQGDLAATDGFYVDVYINPNPAPTAVNQIWSDGRSAQGLTWGVTASMQPGQSITLTIGDAYYLPDYSLFTGALLIGTPVYAQVDSFDSTTTYGAVRENHEIVGAPYNNILGPVLSAAAFAALNVTQPIEKGDYWLPVRLKVQ